MNTEETIDEKAMIEISLLSALKLTREHSTYFETDKLADVIIEALGFDDAYFVANVIVRKTGQKI